MEGKGSGFSSTQKLVVSLSLAAAGAVLLGILLRRLNKQIPPEIDEEEHKKIASSSNEAEKIASKAEEVSEGKERNNALAQELKEQGNKAFKAENYKEAIAKYTEALSLTDNVQDKKFFYGNRSAAYLTNKNIPQAIEDAQSSIDCDPSWSKGYFRLGKAYLAQEDYDLAYLNFCKGLKMDPNSDELKKLLEATKEKLGPSPFNSQSVLETKLNILHLQKKIVDLCNRLGITHEDFQTAFKQSTNKKDLLAHPLISSWFGKSPVEVLQLLVCALLIEDKDTEALSVAAKGVEKNPQNPDSLILLVAAILRQREPDLKAAFEHIWKAYISQGNSKDFLCIQLLFMVLARLLPQIGTPDFPVDVHSILDGLLASFDHPQVTKQLLVECGLSVWIKILQSPEAAARLQEEEQAKMGGTQYTDLSSMAKPTLELLINGMLGKICLNSFFVRALSEVPLTFWPLERMMLPLRMSLGHLSYGPDFETLLPLISSMALQNWKNNYCWIFLDSQEKELHESLLNDVEKDVKFGESLFEDHTFKKPFLCKLAVLALYKPLNTVTGLYDLCKKHLDLKCLHPLFAKVVEKTLYNPEIEKAETIEQITEIPNNDVVNFYNSHVITWDSLPGSFATVTVQQEFEWLFPAHSWADFSGRNRILVAGCGSGQDLAQMALIYDNVEIEGVDFSEANLKYASRQLKELNISNVKLYLGDILSLDKKALREYDVIVANCILEHLPDPIRGWRILVGLLRQGGVMRIGMASQHYIELIGALRKALSISYPELFNTSQLKGGILPTVSRDPTAEELRQVRNLLFDQNEAIQSLPAFTLNEFAGLLFNRNLVGINFSLICQYLKELKLELIGFEFPGVPLDVILAYRADYPDDPSLKNGQYLDEFEKKNPEAFRSSPAQPIMFTCKKI